MKNGIALSLALVASCALDPSESIKTQPAICLTCGGGGADDIPAHQQRTYDWAVSNVPNWTSCGGPFCVSCTDDASICRIYGFGLDIICHFVPGVPDDCYVD